MTVKKRELKHEESNHEEEKATLAVFINPSHTFHTCEQLNNQFHNTVTGKVFFYSEREANDVTTSFRSVI